MPSNDDTKQQTEEVTIDRASERAPVVAVLEDDYAAGADQAGINEASEASISSDYTMPQEFTFFQKKKRGDQAILASSAAFASAAQVAAFAARLDSAMAVNTRTQRHLTELTTLMSDVARDLTADVSKPTRRRLRRLKLLFYGCLVGFGVGWYLLFPSGQNLITQLIAFLAK